MIKGPEGITFNDLEMELKQLVKIIIKEKFIFILVWLGIVAVALIWAIGQKQQNEAFMAIEITREKTSQEGEYQYGQYYRVLADEKFAELVVQWTNDPQVVKKIYDNASIKSPFQNIKQMSKVFKSEKLAYNYIQVKTYSEDKDQAQKLLKSMREVFNEKVQILNETSQTDDWFKLVFSEILIAPKKPSIFLVATAGIIFGAILATMSTLFVYYWKEE